VALHRSHQGHDQPDFRPGILMAINREFIAHMDRAFKEAEDSDRQTAEQLCASNTGSFIELIAELEAPHTVEKVSTISTPVIVWADRPLRGDCPACGGSHFNIAEGSCRDCKFHPRSFYRVPTSVAQRSAAGRSLMVDPPIFECADCCAVSQVGEERCRLCDGEMELQPCRR
jgi:hypothetical protein